MVQAKGWESGSLPRVGLDQAGQRRRQDPQARGPGMDRPLQPAVQVPVCRQVRAPQLSARRHHEAGRPDQRKPGDAVADLDKVEGVAVEAVTGQADSHRANEGSSPDRGRRGNPRLARGEIHGH